MADDLHRQVGPVRVWRCTEAIDPKAGFIFRTVGDRNGRCVELVTSQNTMLFDRRLARQLAEAILAVCGPAEALPSDHERDDLLEIVHHDDGSKTFKPYISRTGSTLSDAKAFADSVRADAGFPPSSLFEYPSKEHASHG